jgi:hypothetical protein
MGVGIGLHIVVGKPVPHDKRNGAVFHKMGPCVDGRIHFALRIRRRQDADTLRIFKIGLEFAHDDSPWLNIVFLFFPSSRLYAHCRNFQYKWFV